MRPSDEKKYVLVSQRSKLKPRRALSVRDYSLPKPYRKPVNGEEYQGRSRTQFALLALAGVLIAGLVGALALLAHENVTTPRARPVVAATGEPGRDGVLAPAVFPGMPADPLALPAQKKTPAGARLPPPGLAGSSTPSRRAAVAAGIAAHAAPRETSASALEDPSAAKESDPDVVLLTAILMLTPPAPVEIQSGTPAMCTAARAASPECAGVHATDP